MGPEELGFVAWSALRKIGDVHDDLIHGDASEKGAKVAVDENVGVFAGKGAGVAVAVSQPEDGGAGVPRKESATVGNAVAFWEVVDE